MFVYLYLESLYVESTGKMSQNFHLGLEHVYSATWKAQEKIKAGQWNVKVPVSIVYYITFVIVTNKRLTALLLSVP
jgi:hypothetical protein